MEIYYVTDIFSKMSIFYFILLVLFNKSFEEIIQYNDALINFKNLKINYNNEIKTFQADLLYSSNCTKIIQKYNLFSTNSFTDKFSSNLKYEKVDCKSEKLNFQFNNSIKYYGKFFKENNNLFCYSFINLENLSQYSNCSDLLNSNNTNDTWLIIIIIITIIAVIIIISIIIYLLYKYCKPKKHPNNIDMDNLIIGIPWEV